MGATGSWRRRPITWPCEYHKKDAYVSQFSLPHTPSHASLVNEGSHAVVFDCSASFWQVQLPEDCNFVVTDHAGDTWRFTRLPYGLNCASEIMQLILDELVQMSAVDGVKTAAHIDGIIATGSLRQVEEFATSFKRHCRDFNVTLNDEEGNKPSTSVTFTGMRFDFSKKAVQLSKKFVDNVPHLSDVRTMQELESLHGKLLYGAAVLRIPLYKYHWYVKTYRRRLSALQRGTLRPDDVHGLSESVLAQLQLLRDEVWVNAWTSIPKHVKSRDLSDDSPILVTDATLEGMGAVLYVKGQIAQSYGITFAKQANSMAAAESAAVVVAIARFAKQLKNTATLLLVDNSSVQSAIEKSKAKSLALQLAVDVVGKMLASLNASLFVAHVPTKDNVADAISRGKPIDRFAERASLGVANEVIELTKSTGVGEAISQLAGG